MKRFFIFALLAMQLLVSGCNGENKDPFIEQHNEKGSLLFQQKKNEEAVIHFNKSIEKNPNYLETYSLRAMPYIELREYDKAESDLRFAISKKDEGYDKSSDYYKMFVLYSRQGKFDKAFKYLDKSLNITRGNAIKRTVFEKGVNGNLPKNFIKLYSDELLKKGEIKKAHEVLLKSIEYYPDYYYSYFGLAYIEENHNKNPQKASSYLKKAKKLGKGKIKKDSKIPMVLIRKSIVDSN